MAFFAILLAIALIGAFGVIVAKYQDKQKAMRQAEMAELAAAHDLDFSETDNFGLTKLLSEFDIMERERSWFANGKISNVLKGYYNGTEICIFDYTYTVSTGKSSRLVSQTIYFAQNKQWYLPNFKLKPETWLEKVKMKFGISDINFADSPEFSDQFWLTSEFEDLTRKVFSPKVRQFLLEKPPVHLEGNNFFFIAYKPEALLSGAEANVFIQHCKDLTDLLKSENKFELLDLAEQKLEALPPIELPVKRDAIDE